MKKHIKYQVNFVLPIYNLPPPSLILILNLLIFLNYSQPYTLKSSVSAQCTFLFARCCSHFFILYFVYFFTQELLNLCFWFILHSLYPTHMFSHHHFICAFCFCCCFYFIIQAILALYTYFVNNNVERKAEKLASHFLKQLN